MKQASYIKTEDSRPFWTRLVSRQWRQTHLFAAGIASLFMVFTLVMLAIDDVEAKRPTNKSIKDIDLNFQQIIEEQPAESVAPEQTTEVEEQQLSLRWHEQTIRNGDNLTTVFGREKLGAGDVHRVATSSPLAEKLARMMPGQKLAFGFDPDGELVELNYHISRLESYRFSKAGNSYAARHIQLRPEVLRAYREGTIESSLFLAGEAAGLPHRVIMDLANIFGWDVDFALDIRAGDHFSLLFEEKFLDGEKISTGNILAASFTNRGETFRAVRYTDAKGHAHYYTPEGLSMRKAFLRAPLDFTRVSSGFNPKRLHPIFKTKRPHRGVDYAASRGTPVYAAGDGKVIQSGYTKANGNFVVIQHGQQYVTKYLHLHRKKVKRGQRVSQRQVIGTVGSTGYSTGPHLHYEFLVNGVHRNPRTVKLPQAKPIAESERANFNLTTAPLIALLDNKGKPEQYALASP